MTGASLSEVAKIIQDYLEQRQKSYYYHKKKTDAEKEYNKLLVNSGGEDKNFTLDQAEKIYSAYCEMLTNDEQSKTAETKFNEACEKLKELGRILFRATITADITIPPVNGEPYTTKQVTVTFPNGEALVV
jgi:Cdc6-like AAA superfamily ATPase